MNLIRYEPWGVLRKFHDDVNRLFDDTGYGDMAGVDRSNVATSHWSPAVDIREEPGQYVLSAEIPGVDPKDIEVSMEDGVLTIKGERSREDHEDGKGYQRVERVYGSFYRRFSLPDSTDGERVTAKGKHGVLEVVIPKTEKVQPRRITVN